MHWRTAQRGTRLLAGAAVLTLTALATAAPAAGPGGASLQELMQARDLSEADVTAALKTYMPTGRHDDYYIFASGGQGGQVLVIGVPSMRILKYVAVFTPEPWQGFGYGDESDQLLDSGNRHGNTLRWADTHHPALSETKGDYDGQFLFIGDKANARIAVIDLRDFVTKQIVKSNLIESDHGGTFVTPSIRAKLHALQRSGRTTVALSPREREVIRLIALGNSNKEIARLLGISPRTVDTHRSRSMAKLGLHSVAYLVRYAVQAGMVG